MASDGRRVAPPPPPDPRGYDYVNAYLEELWSWLSAQARITFSSDFTVTPGASRHVGLADQRAGELLVYYTGPTTISITPGICAAQGASDHVPVWADTSTLIDEMPRENKTISAETLVLLHVMYDADEVWTGTEILLEDAAFDYTGDYQNGYLLLAKVFWDGTNSRIDRVEPYVRASQSHSKCNVYHTWAGLAAS